MGVFCVPKPLIGGFGCPSWFIYGIRLLAKQFLGTWTLDQSAERSKKSTVKVLTAEYSRGTFRSQLVRNGPALAVVPCDNDNNQINDQFAAAPLSSPVLFLAFNNEKLGVEPLHSVRDLTFISEERGRQEI